MPTLASANTFSYLSNVEVVSVKFSTSETKTDAGMKNIYAMFKAKAADACKDEEKTRYSAYDSVEDCVSDLVEQLVDDADMDALTRLHNAPKTTILAQN